MQPVSNNWKATQTAQIRRPNIMYIIMGEKQKNGLTTVDRGSIYNQAAPYTSFSRHLSDTTVVITITLESAVSGCNYCLVRYKKQTGTSYFNITVEYLDSSDNVAGSFAGKTQNACYKLGIVDENSTIRKIRITATSVGSAVKNTFELYGASLYKNGKVFYTNKIKNYSSKNYTYIDGSELPSEEVVFSIDNKTEKIFDSNSIPKKNTEICAFYGFSMGGMNNEFVAGGVYYLTDFEFEENGLYAKIYGQSAMSLLTQPFYRGAYDENGNDDVSTFIHNHFFDSILPIEMNTKFDDFNLYNPMPICTYGEALQYITQFSELFAYISEEGILRFGQIDICHFTREDPYDIKVDNYLNKPKITHQTECPDTLVFKIKEYTKDSGDRLIKTISVFDTEYLTDIFTTAFDTSTYRTVSIGGGQTISSPIAADEIGSFALINWLATPNYSGGHPVATTVNLYATELFVDTLVIYRNSPIPNKTGLNIIDNPIFSSADVSRLDTEIVRGICYYLNSADFEVNMRIDPAIEMADFMPISDDYDGVITYKEINYNGAFTGIVKGKTQGDY